MEIIEFLRIHEIDVALITESHLKPNKSFSLPDHTVIRLDRINASKGGVAIAVRRTLQFRMLPDFRLNIIEAVGIELESPDGPITVIAAYCPKQCNVSDGSSTQLKNDIQILTRRSGKFVLAGDLNARHSIWGNTRNNKNGNVLATDAQSGHYTIMHPDSPTFFSPAGVGSTLDIVLTNIPDNVTTPQALTEMSSDHLPVTFDLNSSINHRELRRRKNYHRANWPRFQQLVEERVDRHQCLDTTEDIDEALQLLTSAINEAEDRYVPTMAISCEFLQLDSLTKRVITLRNHIRRQYQRTQNISRKVLYKKLNRIIASRVQKLRNNKFSNDIKKLQNYSKPFWRLTKVLKTKPKPIPPLIEGGLKHITPSEKANSLSGHFMASHSLGQGIASPMEASVSESVTSVTNTPNVLPEDKRVSTEELKIAIKLSRNMKAPGFDGLFNIALKHLGPNAHSLIVEIFNRCLELSYFPSTWKLSKVVPIHKPGKDPTIPSSYRPISLLSSLSKLFEKCIYGRLLEHSNDNNIFLDEQFGFRRGHSTVHQLQRVANLVRRNKELSKTTVMALLDIEKAFDNVWHDGLTHKLHQYNFPIYLVKIVANYLSDRTSQVSIGSSLSLPYAVNAGVPQGSILGPILYNLYTSDIPALPNNGTLSLFADDSAISYEGRVIRTLVSKLQKGIDDYTSYLTTWKICVNGAKTQTIVFPHSKSERLKPATNIKVQGAEIEWSPEVGYLGLILDSKLLFRRHIDDRVEKSTILLKRLYPIINRRSKASTVNKLAVYKMIVSPMIEYAAPVWRGCAKTHLQKLQVVQNKFLRMILNSPPRTRTTELHRLANIETIVERTNFQAAKIQARAVASESETIRNIYT